MTSEEFFKSLDEAGFDEAEAIEADAGKIFREGWSEEVAKEFVRTVMELRRGPFPGTTVEGAIELTLKYGLGVIRQTTGLDGRKPKRKSKLSGTGI